LSLIETLFNETYTFGGLPSHAIIHLRVPILGDVLR
jgi:hypothetical protein